MPGRASIGISTLTACLPPGRVTGWIRAESSRGEREPIVGTGVSSQRRSTGPVGRLAVNPWGLERRSNLVREFAKSTFTSPPRLVPSLGCGSHGRQHRSWSKGFGYVIKGAEAEAFNGAVETAIAGEHDRFDRDLLPANLAKNLDAREVAGHRQIEQNDRKTARAEPLERFPRAGAGLDLELSREDKSQGFPGSVLVVDDQNGRSYVHEGLQEQRACHGAETGKSPRGRWEPVGSHLWRAGLNGRKRTAGLGDPRREPYATYLFDP